MSEMEMTKDYYETLGIDHDASHDDIRKAFRKLAAKHHPDRNPEDPSAEQRFKEINEAYQTLSDPQKRQQYDNPAPDFGFPGIDFNGFPNGFDDFFGSFFGGGRRTQRGSGMNHGGRDLELNLMIELEDSIKGCKRDVSFDARVACTECDGLGHSKESKAAQCDACKGHGQVGFRQGFISMMQACDKCQGTGQVFSDPCKTCGSNGFITKSRIVTLKIPPGVGRGDSLVMRGSGEAAFRGGQSGDLYVRIGIKPHPQFDKDGANIITNRMLSYADLVLGASFELDVFGEKHTVNVPPGVLPNSTVMVKGAGCVTRNGARGDLHINVGLEMPRELDDKARELLRQFDDRVKSR